MVTLALIVLWVCGVILGYKLGVARGEKSATKKVLEAVANSVVYIIDKNIPEDLPLEPTVHDKKGNDSNGNS